MSDPRISEALADPRLRACCDAYVQATTLHRTFPAMLDAVEAQYNEDEARGVAWSIINVARQFIAMFDAVTRFPRRGPAIGGDEQLTEVVRHFEGQ